MIVSDTDLLKREFDRLDSSRWAAVPWHEHVHDHVHGCAPLVCFAPHTLPLLSCEPTHTHTQGFVLAKNHHPHPHLYMLLSPMTNRRGFLDPCALRPLLKRLLPKLTPREVHYVLHHLGNLDVNADGAITFQVRGGLGRCMVGPEI